MSVREKIIDQSIAQIEKRLKKIHEILDANYISEICQLRIEFAERKGDRPVMELIQDPEWLRWLDEAAAKEKELFKRAEFQTKNTLKLFDERCELEFELSDLKKEKFYIERRKEQRNELSKN